jgi:hypothetical protein
MFELEDGTVFRIPMNIHTGIDILSTIEMYSMIIYISFNYGVVLAKRGKYTLR